MLRPNIEDYMRQALEPKPIVAPAGTLFDPSKLASVYRTWWYVKKLSEFNHQLALDYMIPWRDEDELNQYTADTPTFVEAKT